MSTTKANAMVWDKSLGRQEPDVRVALARFNQRQAPPPAQMGNSEQVLKNRHEWQFATQ
jgi:hypothetical protein